MIKIVGFETRKGEFTPDNEPDKKIPYENILLHFVTNENPAVTGVSTSLYGNSVIKIPAKDFKEVTGCETPNELLEKCVVPHYVPGRNNQVRLGRLEIVRDK